MTTAFVSGQAKPVAFKSVILRLVMLGALAALPLISGCRTSTLIGEFTDECTAIRPVFSMYREEPEAPYSEFNILFIPLIR